MMQKIKKTLIWILVGIATGFGLFAWISKIFSKKKADKIDNQIDNNDNNIHRAQGHIDAVADQREDVVQDVKQHEDRVEDLKQQLDEVDPVVKDVAAAKQNILNKTKRGRKPKKQTP